ncbi:MAG TPA: glycogen debranching N-terminal domain-containing protein, partial [Burkholderiales bacterium]|nr:glycogen debranching N-terminal domain-containing protein [Burkholderiales bacterium]
MRREPEPAASAPLTIPGVVSLAASSRRTLKHGDTFAMLDDLGDIPELAHSPGGLFHFDTRHLSRLVFLLEGHRPLVLSSTVQPDNLTLDVDLTNPDLFRGERLVLAKDTFHVARAKFLWQGSCFERFTVASYAEAPRRLRLAIEFAADFADLFEIRGHRRSRRGAVEQERRGGGAVAFVYRSLDGVARETQLHFDPPPAALAPGRAEFTLELAPRERRTIGVT